MNLQNGKSVVAVVDENGGTESPANSSVAITLQTPASRGSVDKAIQVGSDVRMTSSLRMG